MKIKRFFAVAIAISVAAAVALSMTIVSADARDNVAGFSQVRINDYGLEEYEELMGLDGESSEDEEIGDGEEAGDMEETGDEERTSDDEEPGDDGELGDEEEPGDEESSDTEQPGNEEESGDVESPGNNEEYPNKDVPPTNPMPSNLPNDDEVSGTPIEEFDYEVLGGETVSITGYSGEETDIDIPAEIDGKAVVRIGDGAFYDCDSITSVVIPDGVTSIGDYAFSDWV